MAEDTQLYVNPFTHRIYFGDSMSCVLGVMIPAYAYTWVALSAYVGCGQNIIDGAAPTVARAGHITGISADETKNATHPIIYFADGKFEQRASCIRYYNMQTNMIVTLDGNCNDPLNSFYKNIQHIMFDSYSNILYITDEAQIVYIDLVNNSTHTPLGGNYVA
eukprot:TRINITY_DN14211_c0_g1_i2.p1 TRINITY_DN14211_c0_g1~~TRINITY_DN14211_c0_g1_i2.p1  ORF type:complete len:180 (-),score=17.26 TRINITY_DN14211_c0_g1_i2:88-576(-)